MTQPTPSSTNTTATKLTAAPVGVHPVRSAAVSPPRIKPRLGRVHRSLLRASATRERRGPGRFRLPWLPNSFSGSAACTPVGTPKPCRTGVRPSRERCRGNGAPPGRPNEGTGPDIVGRVSNCAGVEVPNARFGVAEVSDRTAARLRRGSRRCHVHVDRHQYRLTGGQHRRGPDDSFVVARASGGMHDCGRWCHRLAGRRRHLGGGWCHTPRPGLRFTASELVATRARAARRRVRRAPVVGAGGRCAVPERRPRRAHGQRVYGRRGSRTPPDGPSPCRRCSCPNCATTSPRTSSIDPDAHVFAGPEGRGARAEQLPLGVEQGIAPRSAARISTSTTSDTSGRRWRRRPGRRPRS